MFGRIQNIASRGQRLLIPGMPVLLYHRIADYPFDPQLMCVSPHHFSEHLDVLQRTRVPVSLNGLSQKLGRANLPKGGFTITFDDGYADNFINARPILQRYGVPATVFITSANIGTRNEYWWDELERIILHPGSLPERIELEIAGEQYSWDLSGSGNYSTRDFEEYHMWNVLKEGDQNPRNSLYYSLCQKLHPLPHQEIQAVLGRLRELGRLSPEERKAHRSLTAEEIIQMTSDGLIEAGGHTQTHPVMSSLSIADQRREILENKRVLDEILGYPIMGFSYPYGSKGDYSTETISILREAGYLYACSNYAELTRRKTDPYQIPRFLVRDWDGDEFNRQLMGWLKQ